MIRVGTPVGLDVGSEDDRSENIRAVERGQYNMRNYELYCMI